MVKSKKVDNLLLRAENVKIYFDQRGNGKNVVKAVDGISIDIMRNEIFGIVGESGCGKSTFGRGLINLLPLTEGTVYIDDKDTTQLSKEEMKDMRKRMQIIFQDPSACLNPRRKVKEILMEPFKIHGIHDKDVINDRIIELMELVGLAKYHLNRYPHELSGGQKQRIGIARALALEPEFIVCDEAVSALDVSVQAQVLNLLSDLKEKLGLTYFFISHNLNVVYQISDRVGVMYLGKMVEVAPYNSLYNKRYHPYTEALLSAIPQVDKDEQKQRIILKGEVPSPTNPPPGCSFHTRCPKKFSKCVTEIPLLLEVEKDHFVACHLYDSFHEIHNR
ncbi:ATP-binding cassette domain-containing protein [Alkalibaculum sp. M08DMB]|uniref:ATP-binding cassette domain-containing protein n=1 Tax=Alkalibaculum sporogenes TaxID=2655001 RepID=A0A6A7K9F1_9FIRM|nr:oligopeptide/dipeptide ABC transporter ATP-binding protein [Alkalibaculum sporogenes]MPW25985.1 ATP-binding cassette domain-containing protein [Alkalibaculum sporogenes]